MRRGPIVLLGVLSLTTAAAGQVARPPATLPTVDDLLDKYVEALGGQTANARITSRITRSSVELDGTQGTVEQVWKGLDLFAVTTEFGGRVSRLGIFGNSGWIQTGDSAAREMTESELANAKLTMFLQDRRLKTLYKTMTVRGRETVDGVDVYVVETVAVVGNPDRLYFDARNGLLVRMDRTREYGQLVNYLEDYREVDGVKLAFRTRNVFTDGTRTVTIKEVQQNVPIDDAVFRAPKKEKGPLVLTSEPSRKNPGSDLLSHTVTHAVPSAVAGLTSVFGMGTGVTLLL